MRDDRAALVELLAGRPSDLELDRAALEVSRIECPDLDAERAVAQLDEHALAIAERADDLSDGRCFVETANAYLFGAAGFRGSETDYYNPANMCLNSVMETGVGIPITLSVVYMEVARRLAKPVSGVGLPGHFLIRYDEPGYNAIIDPFHGGAILDHARCCELAGMDSLEPAMLDAVDKRQVLMRIINNLRGTYFRRREGAKALGLLDLLVEANPESADEHKQRAAALLQMRRIGDSLAAFRRYLDLAPHAADREHIEEQMRDIAFWIASRN